MTPKQREELDQLRQIVNERIERSEISTGAGRVAQKLAHLPD